MVSHGVVCWRKGRGEVTVKRVKDLVRNVMYACMKGSMGLHTPIAP